tara:strand:- start:1846 stop:2196 length:351 start_codon:yes stop_codon:yes gene_type:complete
MPRYKVPQKIRNAVAKAVEYNLSLPRSKRASMKKEGKKIVYGTGMKTARKLISDNVDENQLRLMAAWFARHGESDKSKKARRDKTSKASIAWALWGGSTGKQWVMGTLRDIDRKKN